MIALVVKKLLLADDRRPTLREAKILGLLIMHFVHQFDLTVGPVYRMGVVTPAAYTDATAELEILRPELRAYGMDLRERIGTIVGRG
jgi:hypothetical protein